MGKIYGYARVSTKTQSVERQIRNIKAEYPTANIREENFTGTTMARPEWVKLMKVIKPGDTIVFDSVSRMSRDADEGINVYMELYGKGVELIFLNERHISTAVYQRAIAKHIDIEANTGREAIDRYISGQGKLLNDLIMDLAKEQIRIAFDQAEKEVQDIQSRVRQGIREKKFQCEAEGRPYDGGLKAGTKLTVQKAEESKKVIAQHCKVFGGYLTDAEVQKLCGCSRNSFYSYKRRLKQLYDNFWNEDNDSESESWRDDLSPAEQTIVEAWDRKCPL